MLIKYKRILISLGIALTSFFLNFITFLITYNKLATPYLHEEQRVENAFFILTATMGLFAAIAIFVGIAFFLVAKKQ